MNLCRREERKPKDRENHIYLVAKVFPCGTSFLMGPFNENTTIEGEKF